MICFSFALLSTKSPHFKCSLLIFQSFPNYHNIYYINPWQMEKNAIKICTQYFRPVSFSLSLPLSVFGLSISAAISPVLEWMNESPMKKQPTWYGELGIIFQRLHVRVLLFSGFLANIINIFLFNFFSIEKQKYPNIAFGKITTESDGWLFPPLQINTLKSKMP